MKLGRRSLLKMTAAGGAGLALAEVGSRPGPRPGRGEGGQADRRQGVHHRLQLLLVRLRHGLPREGRQARQPRGRPRPRHQRRASLCPKGAAMRPTHESPQRRHDAAATARPGSDKWQEISWDEAVDKIASKIKATRDANWIATEKDGDDRSTRSTAPTPSRFLGGAQNTNEECYLFQKMARLLRDGYHRTPGPTLTQPHGPQSGGLVRPRRDDQPLGRSAERQGLPHRGQQRRREPRRWR